MDWQKISKSFQNMTTQGRPNGDVHDFYYPVICDTRGRTRAIFCIIFAHSLSVFIDKICFNSFIWYSPNYFCSNL